MNYKINTNKPFSNLEGGQVGVLLYVKYHEGQWSPKTFYFLVKTRENLIERSWCIQ